MRMLVLALIFASQTLGFSAYSSGWDCVPVVATVPAPVPIAYSASDVKSLLMSGLAPGKYRNLIFINKFAADLCVNWSEGNTATAPSSTVDAGGRTREMCTVSGGNLQFDTSVLTISKRVYLRSYTGAALTTGWGHLCVF